MQAAKRKKRMAFVHRWFNPFFSIRSQADNTENANYESV